MKAQEALNIADKVIRCSSADETEVRVHFERYALTRFANNFIHQNLSQDERIVHVGVHLGNKLGEARGNRTGSGHLKQLVETAIELAGHAQPDDELLPLPEPQDYESVNAMSKETDAAGPGRRAEAVKEIVKACKADSLTVSGAFETVSELIVHANSKGLKAMHRSTNANLSVTAAASNSTGWSCAASRNIDDINASELAGTALEKAKLSVNPKELPAGTYPVILEPDALYTLICYVTEGFNARDVYDGESFLKKEQLGSPVTGEDVTLVCNPYDPVLQGSPFDYEGSANRVVGLIRNGVAEEMACDRLTAKKMNVRPNGYSFGGSNKEGAWPNYVVMDGGTTSLEEMISSSDKAILVTRLWYPSLVDPKKLIVTGMTRDGTFLVEGGKIVSGLRNFRFNVSVLEMLKTIEQLGPQKYCLDTLMQLHFLVPSAKVGQFRFTSGTDF